METFLKTVYRLYLWNCSQSPALSASETTQFAGKLMSVINEQYLFYKFNGIHILVIHILHYIHLY